MRWHSAIRNLKYKHQGLLISRQLALNRHLYKVSIIPLSFWTIEFFKQFSQSAVAKVIPRSTKDEAHWNSVYEGVTVRDEQVCPHEAQAGRIFCFLSAIGKLYTRKTTQYQRDWESRKSTHMWWPSSQGILSHYLIYIRMVKRIPQTELINLHSKD